MMSLKKLLSFSTAGLLLSGLAGVAHSEYGLNFPEPGSTTAQDIYDIHMLTTYIVTALLVLVFGFVFYSLYAHRKSKGFEADQNFHNSWFGHWSWVIVPVLVLGVDLTIAGKADRLSTRDEGDTQRIPPGGTPGYTVLTVRGEWQARPDLTVSAALENLTDEDYRVHGSGQNEPGLNAVVGLNWKF